MFEGKQPLPECCTLLCDTLYGKKIPGTEKIRIYLENGDSKYVSVDEWIVKDVNGYRVFSHDDFNLFFREIKKNINIQKKLMLVFLVHLIQ